MRGGRLIVLLMLLALAGATWWWVRSSDAVVGSDDLVGDDTAGSSDDPKAGLAGHAVVKPLAGPASVVPQATVLGEILRAGKPAAARVTLYESARSEPGVPAGWVAQAPKNRVPLDGPSTRVVARTLEAGADGRFTVELPAPASYDVVAAASDGARAIGAATLPTAGGRVSVRLNLRGGGETLTGRAVYTDGRPFHGQVCAEAPSVSSDELEDLRAVTTTDDGHFTIEGLETGPYVVSAFVPGRWRAFSRTVTIPHRGAEYVLTVDGGAREVAGRVVADKDGAPLPGATVLAFAWSPPGLQSFESRAVADAEGRFKIYAPGNQSTWQVYAAGYAALNTYRNRMSEAETLEFRLQKAGRIVGRVTNEGEGQPVAGLSVYAETNGDPFSKGAHAVTGADGRYELTEVRPGEVTVFALGGGWFSKGIETADPNGYDPLGVTLLPEGSATIDLVVSRGARAKGRVLDAKGLPVVGAQVTPTRLLPGRRNAQAFGWIPAVQAVATGEGGTFVLDTLIPGFSYNFDATAPDASPGKAGPLRAEVDKPLEVELKLGIPRWAEITCLEKGGGPIVGINVYAYTQTPNQGWVSHGQASTGSGGIARLGPLPTGPVILYAWGEGYQSDENKPVGGPEGATEEIHETLTLRRTFAVSGVAKWTDGSPAAGLVIEVAAPHMSTQSQLDADGSFRFDGFEEGSVEIKLMKDWNGTPLVTTRGKIGEEITITVPGTKPERMTVRVLDPDGKPVPSATVQLQSPDGSSGENAIEGKAEFAVPGKESSVLVYGAQTPGGAPLPYGLRIAGPVAVQTKEFEVKLVPELRIEGVVTSSDGRPARGVRVSAAPKDLPAPFAAWNEVVSTARSDDQGRFRLGRLGPGTYLLTVAASEIAGPTEPKEAKAGESAVSIVLGEGLDASPVILDPQGEPVAGATVRATVKPNGRASLAETDGNGVARLHGLDKKATYRLDITPTDDRDDVLPLVLDPWRVGDDPIHLNPGLFVAGMVRDGSGQAVANAQVERLGANGAEQRVPTKKDGSFVMKRIPAGDVRLLARRDDPAGASRPITSTAGTKDLVLVIDATVSLKVEIEDWKPVADGWWFNLIDEETKVGTDWAQLDAEGKAKLDGLHPDAKYTLFLVRDPENEEPTVAWKAGIAGSAGELKAKLEPGLGVGGRVLFPPGVTAADVQASDGLSTRGGAVDESGTYLVKGLHAGRWKLTATCDKDGTAYKAEAQVDAGGRVDLDLKAAR